MAEVIEALVEGGKATPGPPIGPALGPLGVNIGEIIKVINAKTRDFEGMKVPVKIRVDAKTKAFEVTVGTPPVSALVLKELGVEKGSGARLESVAGDLSMDQVIKIARMKADSLLGATLKAKAREVIGSCVSIGVTIDGKTPKEILARIDGGEITIEG